MYNAPVGIRPTNTEQHTHGLKEIVPIAAYLVLVQYIEMILTNVKRQGKYYTKV